MERDLGPQLIGLLHWTLVFVWGFISLFALLKFSANGNDKHLHYSNTCQALKILINCFSWTLIHSRTCCEQSSRPLASHKFAITVRAQLLFIFTLRKPITRIDECLSSSSRERIDDIISADSCESTRPRWWIPTKRIEAQVERLAFAMSVVQLHARCT